MTKQTLRLFLVLGALLLTAVAANAQSQRSQITKVPFNFNVGEKTLPAGDYVVKPNRPDSNGAWLIQSTDGHNSVLVNTRSLQASKAQKRTRLVFNKYGDQYFLSQIWTDGSDSGRELRMRGQERDLEKNVIAQRTTVLSDGTAIRD